MSKLSDFIAEAGACADAVPHFAVELILALEARIEALEARFAPDKPVEPPAPIDPA